MIRSPCGARQRVCASARLGSTSDDLLKCWLGGIEFCFGSLLIEEGISEIKARAVVIAGTLMCLFPITVAVEAWQFVIGLVTVLAASLGSQPGSDVLRIGEDHDAAFRSCWCLLKCWIISLRAVLAVVFSSSRRASNSAMRRARRALRISLRVRSSAARFLTGARWRSMNSLTARLTAVLVGGWPGSCSAARQTSRR